MTAQQFELDQGFQILDSFMSENDWKNVLQVYEKLYREGSFVQAKIGRNQNVKKETMIRSDQIYWLEMDQLKIESDPLHFLFQQMESLKKSLSEQYWLPLRRWEAHFAFYGPGGYYKKHVDQFESGSERLLSFILYLNEFWRDGDGGELVIYPKGQAPKKIEPKAGRLVLFKSQEIEHEVLPSNKNRKSFTGWFRSDAEPL